MKSEEQNLPLNQFGTPIDFIKFESWLKLEYIEYYSDVRVQFIVQPVAQVQHVI